MNCNVLINTLDALAIYSAMGVRDPDRFRRYGYDHAGEYGVLDDMAAATGAIFVHFNNDLAGAMREISEPPESYSIFAFAPVNLPVDGKYHSLKLSLVGKSEFMNSVQAQRGFFCPESHRDERRGGKTNHCLNVDFEVMPGNYTPRVVASDANKGKLPAQDSPISLPN